MGVHRSTLLLLALVGACTRFSPADEAAPSDGGTDAGADTSVGPDAIASDGGTVDGSEIGPVDAGSVVTDGFETGCGAWSASGMKDGVSPHGGNASCKVCSAGGMASVLGEFVVESANLSLSIYVRTADGDGNPIGSIVRLGLFTPDDSDAMGTYQGADVTTSAGAWREARIDTILVKPTLGKRATVTLEMQTSNGCLSIDDLRIEQH